MKKIISFLLIMLMVICTATGCKDKGPAAELIARYEGDWNGVVAFEDCTGKYEDSLGGSMTGAIARFIIDKKGTVTPFIGLHVEDTPIENLTARFDTERGSLLVSGEWISVSFTDVQLTEDNGLLKLDIPLSKDEGSVKLVFRLRRLDDENWDYSQEPNLSESNVEYCLGLSFDELAEINGYSKGDYPEADAGVDEQPSASSGGGDITGDWESVDMSGVFYKFGDGGKGAYVYSGTEMPFTYTLGEGTVSILFDGNSFPSDHKYEIKGNSLFIEDSFGSKVEYKKK